MRTVHALVVITFFASSSSVVVAQHETAPHELNSIFVEAFGNGVYWSLNYDYTYFQTEKFAFSMRIGASVSPLQYGNTFIALPVGISLSYGTVSMAELSVGATAFTFESGGRGAYGSNVLVPVLYGGYRLQQREGGFFLRAGILFVPIGDVDVFDRKGAKWGWNPGLSVGYTLRH